MSRPAGSAPAGLAQHPVADGHDEACILCQWDELLGRHHAVAGLLPPYQRFRTQHLTSLQVYLWLIMQNQTLIEDRGPEFHLHCMAFLEFQIHLGKEEADPASSLFLCTVERQIGRFHHFVGLIHLSRFRQRHPGAEANVMPVAIQFDGRCEFGKQTLTKGAGIFHATQSRLNDREFVASKASQHVAGSQTVM